MGGYEWTMVGLISFAVVWTPVVLVAWLQPETIQPPSDRTWVAPVERVVEDMSQSVGIAVARTTGPRVSEPLRSLYVYAARHASRMWDRPSAFVRRHARRGKAYYETLSVVGRRDFLGDRKVYKPRHMKMGIA